METKADPVSTGPRSVAPITSTLAGLTPVLPFNRVTFDPHRDLPTLAELYADGGKGISEQLDLARAYHDTDDAEIPVLLGAMSFPWLVATVAFGSLLTANRVPDLSPGNVSYAFAEYGSPRDLVFRGSRFTALPTDPVAGEPGVTLVDDLDSLRAVLRRELGDHLAGTLTILRGRGARVGMDTIRRTAAGACLSALCSVAAKLDRRPELRAVIAATFQGGGREDPLHLRTIPVIHEFPTRSGGLAVSAELSTCCLQFRLPGRGTCPACPNQDPAERTRRMAEGALLYG